MPFKTQATRRGFVAAAFAVATLGTATAGWAGEGHGLGFGHAGSPSEVDRTIRIEARDIAFDRDKIAAKPGETIRFVITNTGQMAHDFTLGPPSVQKSHRREMRQMMQSGGMGHAGDAGQHHDNGGHYGANNHHGDGGHDGNDGHHGGSQGRMNQAHGNQGHGYDRAKGHNDPNAVMVQPGETKELIWHFEKVAGVKFGCNVPGHYQSGMHGNIRQRR